MRNKADAYLLEHKIHGFLGDELGFERGEEDPCIYMRKDGARIVLIPLYVGDRLIAASNMEQIL